MENKKRKCIFHIPNKLDEAGMSGSQVRPRKMLEAFRTIGYDVDVIMGYGAERKAAITEIKHKIRNGVKYDFLYSESSTMPTLLTEQNHLPKYPTLDFGLFKFCKKHGIKIGLFYRDTYWKFPAYKHAVSRIKYYIAILAYKYDLFEYTKTLTAFYLPSKKVAPYIEKRKLIEIMGELPPGSDYNAESINQRKIFFKKRLENFDHKLELFYVGGISNHYIFDELLKALNEFPNVFLTICCREKEWKENKKRFLPYLTNRIEIVHASGVDLEKYYSKADICLSYFKTGEYMNMAIPIKLFEYISHVTPVIVTKGTAMAKFVEENSVGWSIDYSSECLKQLLKKLQYDYLEIYTMHENCISALLKNRWEDRAKQVAEQLCGDT